mgnify:CR=1 FL=1
MGLALCTCLVTWILKSITNANCRKHRLLHALFIVLTGGRFSYVYFNVLEIVIVPLPVVMIVPSDI